MGKKVVTDYKQGPELLQLAPPEAELEADTGFVLTVSAQEVGLRLDRLLALRLPEVSRRRIQTWIEQGCVSVLGIKVGTKITPSTRLGHADVVVVDPPDPPELLAFTPEPIAFEVVFEDAAVIVVNKQAGLVVHPAAGNWSGTLLNGLIYRYPELLSLPRAGIVHRLDKDTSGLMVVARTHAAQLSLVNQLKDHSVSRQYLAITTRPPVPSSGTVNQPIGRDPRNRLRMAISLSGKPSITHYQTRASSSSGAALVDCTLETGRTHQIRVHMASLKAPLVSDVLYGAPSNPLISRQALHALNLAFLHPVSGAMQTFKSSLPEDLMQTLNALALSDVL